MAWQHSVVGALLALVATVAMAEPVVLTAGRFTVTVDDGGGSTIQCDHRPVVTRDRPALSQTSDWKIVFPSAATRRRREVTTVGPGRQAVIAEDEPGVGAARKVITVTPDWVDYRLEFTIEPGRAGTHQSQWFVILDAVEGGRYTAETLATRHEAAFHSAPGSPNLVAEVRRCVVPTAAGPMTFDFGDSDLGWHLDDYTQFWARNYLFYNRKDLPARAGCRRRLGFRLYAGDQPPVAPRYTPVSLAAAATTGFADDQAGDRRGGWTDDGPNDLRALPLGRRTFRGVPFDIIDPAQNAGRSCIVLRGQAWKGHAPRDYFPEQAEIAVGATATTLYVLQCCAWPAPDGQTAAHYVLQYEDGSSETIELRSGADLRDWYHLDDGDHSFVAWANTAPSGGLYGTHVWWWSNPHPERRIARLTYRSANTSAVPALLALTLSDQPPRLFGDALDVSVEGAEPTWLEHTMPWCDDTPGTATDASGLLDGPAGKHGFVTLKDGHLAFADGQRARFWGINLDRVPCFPHHDNAVRIAAHLAKYGVNAVRLHCLESFQPTAANVFDQTTGHSFALSPTNMDRLDFFLAELKKRGVYVIIDLWGYRRFLPGDGFAEQAAWNAAVVTSVQGGVFFDARLQQIERDYARLLLTHRNPYTGLTLATDPQLALLQLFNEVTLLCEWQWAVLPPGIAQQAQAQWNAWLVRRYGDRARLAATWGDRYLSVGEDPQAGTVPLFTKIGSIGQPKGGPEERLGEPRLNDTIRFLSETDQRHAEEMRRHLRELGVRIPIGNSGDIGETAAAVRTAAANDWIDPHTYWQHPSYPNGTIRQYYAAQLALSPFTPLGIEAALNTVSRTSTAKTSGLALVNTEWNAPWPNEHRYEAPLFLAAYGALQDWDGLLSYAWTPVRAPGTAEQERVVPAIERWQSDTDPARAGTWVAAATLFLRGDVQAARRRVAVVHDPDDPYAARWGAPIGWRQPHNARHAPFRVLPFLSRVESTWHGQPPAGATALIVRPRLAKLSAEPYLLLQRGDDPAQQVRVPVPAETGTDPEWFARGLRPAAAQWSLWPADHLAGHQLVSDTDELAWRYGDKLLTIDTPRSQGAVGELSGREVKLSALTVSAGTARCAVIATALDGRPLRESQRILLSTAARSRNTGQRIRRLGNWATVLSVGTTPVVTEPVKARVRLARRPEAAPLRAWRLAPSGQRAEALSPATAGDLTTDLPGTSCWYELAGE